MLPDSSHIGGDVFWQRFILYVAEHIGKALKKGSSFHVNKTQPTVQPEESVGGKWLPYSPAHSKQTCTGYYNWHLIFFYIV